MIKVNTSQGLREAAECVLLGLNFQEKKDYEKSRPMFHQGIEKIKKVLIRDQVPDKELVFEYV
jgi:hypothetical protein